MSIPGIRRRLRALESLGSWMLIDRYPQLTRSEVLDIEQRARRGEEPTKLELALVERQSPIIDGELLMSAHRGQLFMKRYLGIDLAEV
jgi:hypothetical protein